MNKDLTGVRGVMVLLVMFVAWLCATSAAQAAMFDDVVVDEIVIPRPTHFRHGSVEYRFRVYNSSTARTRVVTLELPGEITSGIGSLKRTVSLAPETQAYLSLWQPEMNLSGYNLLVHVDGKAFRGDMLSLQVSQYQPENYYTSSGAQSRLVLASPAIMGEVRDALEKRSKTWAENPSMHSRGQGEFDFDRATVPPAVWSDAWQAYTAYDGVVVTAADMQTLSAPVRQAIQTYVELGGSLLVIGQWDLPDAWLNLHGREAAPTVRHGVSVRAMGFGLVASTSAAAIADWDDDAFKAVDDMLWQPVYSRENEKKTVRDSNHEFAVIESTRVPVRAMFALMIVFAILIGPVNMFIFAKLNKRILTLVTIPVVAIAFSLAVLIFALLAEGISAQGRTSTLTLLDQTTGKATTVGWIGLYAPLQPGDGLRFAGESQVLLQNNIDSWNNNVAADRSIDWSQGQHLNRGWVSARVPAYLTYKNSQTRREQLQVSQDASGQITVVNGLGADIDELKLTDEQGVTHVNQGPINAGERVQLLRLPDADSNQPRPVLDNLTTLNWRSSPSSMQSYAQSSHDQALQRGTYRAVLTEPVFAEPGLAGLKRHDSQTLVLGRYASTLAGRSDTHAD